MLLYFSKISKTIYFLFCFYFSVNILFFWWPKSNILKKVDLVSIYFCKKFKIQKIENEVESKKESEGNYDQFIDEDSIFRNTKIQFLMDGRQTLSRSYLCRSTK